MLENIGVCPESNGSFAAAWDVYQRWNTYALRAKPNEMWEERETYFRMKDFREKLCKPTNRIAFLGLFDTIVIAPGAWILC
jgi:uncharacterized protein (DUF2235 family)